MTPSPARRLLLAALGLAASSVPALAGWNQVANVTCNDGPIRRAFKPAADCCPDTTPAPLARRSSATLRSSAIRTGRGGSRARRRRPDSRVTVEPSRRGQPLGRRSHAGYHGLQVAVGDGVFHEAHAPPDRSS